MQLRLALALALHCAVAASVLTPTALSQTQYFVDPVIGDDAHSGSNPAAPFRSLSRAAAAARLVAGETVIFGGPGEYSAATGEAFPIRIGANSRLHAPGAIVRGTAGAPGGSHAAFITEGSGSPASHGIEGLQIEGFPIGIRVETASAAEGWVEIRDVTIRGCAMGIVIETVAGSGQARPQIRGCGVFDGGEGIQILGSADMALYDTTFERLQGTAIYGVAPAATPTRLGAGRLTIDTCSVGIGFAGGPVAFDADLDAVAISRCTTAFGYADNNPTHMGIRFRHATIAGNTQAIYAASGEGSGIRFDRSILTGNGSTFGNGQRQVTVLNSIVPDLSVTGPGLVRADATLADLPAGDLRLVRGSVGIDAFLDPGIWSDGNLDTSTRRDYGALEYRTQRLLDAAVSGASIRVESDTAGIGLGLGLLSRTRIADGPLSTPFGALRLEVPGIRRAGMFVVPPGSSVGRWTLELPADPQLVGSTWSVQTLSPSSMSPAGAALSDATEFTIQ